MKFAKLKLHQMMNLGEYVKNLEYKQVFFQKILKEECFCDIITRCKTNG